MINICPNCKGIIGSEKICPKCGIDTSNPSETTESRNNSNTFSTINQSLVDVYIPDTKASTKSKSNNKKSKSHNRYSTKTWIIAISSFVGTLAILSFAILFFNKHNLTIPELRLPQDNTVSNQIHEEMSKSPIESLNDQERMIYEALMIGVKDFYNPQAVRVLEVVKANGDDECYITITGTNKMGGTLQKNYYLQLVTDGSDKKGDMLDWTEFDWIKSLKIKYNNVDIGNINRAIKQYWEDLGMD